MISANGGLPAHRYTPQVTPRWSRGSEPASGGVCRCDPYGVRFAFWRRVLGACIPGGRAASAGDGGRWSQRRGMPFLRVVPGARHDVLFSCVPVPVSSPSWPLGGFLLPRCVTPGALSLWAPASHLGRFRAPLPECPSLLLALPLPVPFPFPVWWWWGGGGALLAQAWGWVVWTYWRRVWGV